MEKNLLEQLIRWKMYGTATCPLPCKRKLNDSLRALPRRMQINKLIIRSRPRNWGQINAKVIGEALSQKTLEWASRMDAQKLPDIRATHTEVAGYLRPPRGLMNE